MKNLAITSDENGEIQYFTLFKKGLQRPKTNHESIKILPKGTQKIVERPAKTWRRENIQLETVLGKLLTSYAVMMPKDFDIAGKWLVWLCL